MSCTLIFFIRKCFLNKHHNYFVSIHQKFSLFRTSMDNQAIYLAKLYSLRENLYKNNLNTAEKKARTSFESYLDSRHSKLFSDILSNDMHHKPGRSGDMSKNTFKEFDGKIIPKTIINSKTQMKMGL